MPLLFLLALRAFVPLGYMPTRAEDGGMKLVLCSAGWQAGDKDRGPDTPSTHDDPPCPFALAATLAPPPAAWHVTLAAPAPVGSDIAIRTRPTIPAPPRHAAPRGPPGSTSSIG